METQFYILLSLRTPRGFEDYGQYFLGNDKEAASALFGELRGSRELNLTCPLHIDLMETVNDLPEKVETICCTLDEMAENSKIIAKEIFRKKNMDET